MSDVLEIEQQIQNVTISSDENTIELNTSSQTVQLEGQSQEVLEIDSPVQIVTLNSQSQEVLELESSGGGGGIDNIDGLIEAGDFINIDGSGTIGDPFVINAEADVKGPDISTHNTLPRWDGGFGRNLKRSDVMLDDANNMTVPGTLTVGFPESPDVASIQAGTTDTTQKGLVVQMINSTTANAFEIQDNKGKPAAQFRTFGNGRLALNYSGEMAEAAFPGFVLSVQNIGDSGEGSWLEILNSGGANTGAFFGMAGNQFQQFNWQGGDIEFWTFPVAANGYPRLTISNSGNFGFDGTDQFQWSGGYGGGVGVLAVRNAKTVPITGESNVAMFYSEAGEMYTMSSDAVKTRLSNKVIALTDGATPALNAKLGNVFTLSAAGDRTIGIPSNPTSGQRITIRHTASGANRTLALNTGTGGFRFGATITGLTITTSGLTDYIECLYNATANKWDVINYQKGF